MEGNGADVDEGAELGSIEMDTSMALFFLVRDGRMWEGTVYFEVVVVVRWARREPLSRE